MKLYLGCETADIKNYQMHDRVLISYWAFRNRFDPVEWGHEDFFLDSGAFTAFNSKKTIDIDAYIAFLKKNNIKTYAALDVIYDPIATAKNLAYMEASGLKPIPVFHYRTPLSELQKLISDHDYIALGGLVPLSMKKKELYSWLDTCFSALYAPVRDGKLKVHGFGVSNVEVLKRYPFYSVDSTSWKQGATFGNVTDFTDGRMDNLDKNPRYKMLQQKRDWLELNLQNIEAFRKIETFITALWSKRGIVYP